MAITHRNFSFGCSSIAQTRSRRFSSEFLAHPVLPGGETVEDAVVPVEEAYRTRAGPGAVAAGVAALPLPKMASSACRQSRSMVDTISNRSRRPDR